MTIPIVFPQTIFQLGAGSPVSIKHRQIHVHPLEYVCIIHEKTNTHYLRHITLGTSRGLNWENKSYKLKKVYHKVIAGPGLSIYNLKYQVKIYRSRHLLIRKMYMWK